MHPRLRSLAAVVLLTACTHATPPAPDAPAATAEPAGEAADPPMAKQVPHRFEEHGGVRTDEYFWLKQRDNPEVIAYLQAENAHTDAVMAPTAALQETLYQELAGRLEPDESTVPYFENGYWYGRRYAAGKDYPIYVRRQGSLEAPEEVILDGNLLAAGKGYFALAGVAPTENGRVLAFATDEVGRRIYTLRFKDLASGELLADTIPTVTGDHVWANDHRTLFYVRQDLQTLRSNRVYRHRLGSDPARDELVYEERDETFSVSLQKTKSDAYLLIESSQTLASEVRYLDAARPGDEWRVLEPRRRGHEYRVDHLGDRFYIRTNDEARNFRLMSAPVATPGRAQWREVVAHRDDVFLASFELFRDFLVLSERRDGLGRLRVRPWSGAGEHEITFDDPTYDVEFGTNVDPDSTTLRYEYSSLTTPSSVYDYDLRTRQRVLRKRDPVLGGFDPASYEAFRLHATAADGTRVPISLVARKGTPRDGSAPLLLYGYGSYGSSADASFQPTILSLLDRGFVYAIAHVRGGQELGRAWYEDGKLLRKKNTFTDFIACAEHLVAERWTAPRHLFAMGGSAGGLLMGAVANLRPDLFAGIVSRVPFVDVITTMMDATIPLTAGEWDEWGDPRQKDYYDYMLSYSPYDQIERKAYPHMLVTTGLHDSQVQYWEPAKYVARLRASKTDSNRLLLHTNMEAGHGGASGRFRRLRETALIYAFLLDLAQAAPKSAS